MEPRLPWRGAVICEAALGTGAASAAVTATGGRTGGGAAADQKAVAVLG